MGYFLANLSFNSLTKEFFENRLTFGEVMGESLVSCFFDSRCRLIGHRKEDELLCQLCCCAPLSFKHGIHLSADIVNICVVQGKAFSALTLSVERREKHPACKN